MRNLNFILSLKKQISNSSLIKQTGVYTLSNLLEKGIPFAILPILTRLLSIEDVGLYTLYQAVLALIIPMYTLSIDSSVVLNYFKINKKRFRIYFSTGIYLFLISIFFLTLLSFFLRAQITEFTTFPFFWFLLIVVIVGLQFLTTIRKSLWQIQDKPKKFAYFSVLLSLSKNLFGLVLILYTDLGWKGIIIGHIIGLVLFSIYSIFSFNQENLITNRFNKNYVIDLLKIGFPLSLHRFGAWLSDSLNRIVIASIIGVGATGSYGIGATFGIIVTIAQDAFNRAYVPYLFKKLKIYSEEVRKSLLKTTLYFYVGIFSFSLIISVFGYFGVGFLFGDEYNDTNSFIIPLVFSAAFNGLYKIHANYIFFTKKTYKIMFITLFMGVLNIGLVYFLVSNYGILGAAYATLTIQILSYLATFSISNKLYPVFIYKRDKNDRIIEEN